MTSGVRPNVSVAASDATADSASPATHWTPQRLRILSWLQMVAPAVAPVYQGAVQLQVDADFPGRVWFVAHALRDMRNRLPDAIAGPVAGSSTEYRELAAAVAKCWFEDGLPKGGRSPIDAATDPTVGGPERFEVSAPLINAVGDLVAGHLAIGPRKKDRAQRLFSALAGQPVPEYAVQAWIDTTDRAERFAHLRNKPLTAQQLDEFDGIFLACEGALLTMASRSYENMDEVDEILDSANR